MLKNMEMVKSLKAAVIDNIKPLVIGAVIGLAISHFASF
jgi:hypothetical protein